MSSQCMNALRHLRDVSLLEQIDRLKELGIGQTVGTGSILYFMRTWIQTAENAVHSRNAETFSLSLNPPPEVQIFATEPG